MIADLDVEHSELAQTWKAFIRHLPPEERVDWEERSQTASDVQELVRNLQTFWMSRPRQRVFSRCMTLCEQFLPTVDTHATILAVLPDADAYYIPLLYGVLQSVLKVSCTRVLNHYKVNRLMISFCFILRHRRTTLE